MGLRHILLPLLAATALLAQNQAQPKPGVVEGMVVNAATRAPVPKATVSLANGQGWPARISVGVVDPHQFSRVGVTDAAGKFRIENLEPGAYHVEFVHAPGYVYETSRPPAIAVAEEQRITGLVLELLPFGSISGKVLDADGEALQNAQVAIMEYHSSNGSKILGAADGATTDDRGEYRVFHLRPGRYYVRVWLPPGQFQHGVLRRDWLPNMHRAAPELGYVPVFYPNGTDISQASPIALAAGGQLGGIDFRLRSVPVFHVRGRISGYDPAGPPALVLGGPCTPSDGAGEYGAKVQSDGRFDVPGFPAGVFCLDLRQSGDGRTLYATQSVTIKDRSLEDVVLRGMPAFAVPGIVRVEGPPTDPDDVVIMAMPASPSGPDPNSALVGDGKFTLEGSVPGTFHIAANRLPPTMYVKSIRYGEEDLPERRVRVRPGGALLTVVLGSDGGQLSATVQAATAGTAGELTVVLVPAAWVGSPEDLIKWGRTDSAGHVQITGLAPGEYKVYAYDDPDPFMPQSPDFRQQFSSRAETVTIAASASTSVQLKGIAAEEIRKVKAMQ